MAQGFEACTAVRTKFSFCNTGTNVRRLHSRLSTRIERMGMREWSQRARASLSPGVASERCLTHRRIRTVPANFHP